MTIDLTLQVTPLLRETAGRNEQMVFSGHLGTHFDVMDQEFPLAYTKRKGIVFDVSGAGEEITVLDVDPLRIREGMCVLFYTGFLEKEGYGSHTYMHAHPYLSEKLIDLLLEKQVSLIGIDFAGIRRGKEHTPADLKCAQHGTFIIENLCSLQSLLSWRDGFTVNCYPMHFSGMSGLPCRVTAEQEDGNTDENTAASEESCCVETEDKAETGDKAENEKEGTCRIRAAVPEDAERLLEIYRYYVVHTAISFECTVPSVEEFQNRIIHTLRKYPYLVVEENGIVQGYTYAGAFVGREAYRYSSTVSIYVSHDRKGRGYGRMLYEALEKELKAMGIRNLYACIGYPVTEDEYLTKNSEQFHGHIGYTKVGEFHNCAYKFHRWYDMIWMEKWIGDHPCAE